METVTSEVTTRELRAQLSDVLGRAMYAGERIGVTRNGKLAAAAARQIKKLPRPARDRVLDAIEDLAEDPRPHGARKLVGEQHAWRV